MSNNVRVGVSTPGAKQATGEIKSVHDAFTRLQKGGAKGFAIGAGAAATTKAFSLVGQAISSVTNYLGDSADAFIAEQRSIQQLNTSLRANVQGWTGNTKAIEEVLQARMKLGFSDDEQRASLARLVAATHDVNRALEIQRTAMDLARFKGISLAEATDALTKVEAGSFRILKSLGIALKDGATQTEALAAVQKVAAGQAEDYADTIEGDLIVAQVKAEEASEKFGKSVAQLQSVVLPAAADAISDLAGKFEALEGAGEALTGSTEDQILAAGDLINIFQPWAAGLVETELAATKQAKADREVTTAVEKMRGAMFAATPAIEETAEETAAMADAARDAEREIDDLADTLSDDLFGDAINAGNIAQLQKTYKELLKQRDGAKEGSREYKILTGRIAENRQELFELHLTQAEKEGPQAAIEFLRKEKQRAGDTTGALQELIEKYRKLAGMQGTLGPIIQPPFRPGSPGRRRARGGPVSAGEAYIVGEERAEVFVPDSNGTILPSVSGVGGGSAWAGGGGTLTVNVNIAGGVMTPGGAQQVMQHLGPHIASYLKGRGFRTA